MLFSRTARLALSLALSLLCSAASFAQTPPAAPKAVPTRVQLRVSFVTASAVDVDNLPGDMGRVPSPLPAAKPPPGGTFLQCLTGDLAAQLYQTIIRTRGKAVQAPLLITDSGAAATVQVPKWISYHKQIVVLSGEPMPRPEPPKFLPLRLALSVTPRVSSDGSVVLEVSPRVGNNNAPAEPRRYPLILRTVPSGGTLIVAGLPINDGMPVDDQELLIFVTPTVIGADVPAATIAASHSGYHWHTLVLQHAVPSDMLKLMHWDSTAPSALPAGVRRVFALQSNNSLLLQTTEEGFAMATGLIRALDVAPRRVRFGLVLVAVSEARAGFYTPDMPASRLLPLLLANGGRTVSVPTLTVTDGVTGSFSIAYTPPPVDPLRLVQAEGADPASAVEARLTPRINADGTVTLGLTLAGRAPSAESRTARAGESVAYDISEALGARGGRVFLFVSPVIVGEDSATP